MSIEEKKSRNRMIIAITASILFAFLIIGLMFVSIPIDNKNVLNTLAGFVGGAFTTMIAYYFGDSDSNNHNPPNPKAQVTQEPCIDCDKKDDNQEIEGK